MENKTEKKNFVAKPRILVKLGEIRVEPGVSVSDIIFFNGRRHVQLASRGNEGEYDIFGEDIKTEDGTSSN